jgi:hypothetical protein
MRAPVEWYRSDTPLGPEDAPRPSVSRAIRNWLRDRLPEPDVRGKTIVLYARQGFRTLSAWAGMFSEFHSVLGALAHAEAHHAAGVRVDFRSALYLDRDRGPNWWTYFFQRAEMSVCADAAAVPDELHLNGVLAKYGKHGGFCDVVNGTTPYLYPMTYGVSRGELHRLLQTHIELRPEIRDEIGRVVAASLARDAFVVGVHYRGTDSTHGFAGALLDYRTEPVPYAAYGSEVRRVLDAAAPRRYQVAVATDEIEFLEFMRREFGDRVFFVADAPRVHAGGTAIHFDQTLGVSNYQKAKSGLIDCLLLAATNYLVKGRSNLSDASLAFNPRLPYSFCVR